MAPSAAVIPGDPDELDRLRRQLETFAVGMSAGARKLRAIRSDERTWKGDGGDAFRAALGGPPATFDAAGVAFTRAAVALARYIRVLREAQADAARAAALPVHVAAGGSRLLADARRRVDAAAARLGAEVRAAADHAPHRPGLLHRIEHGLRSAATFQEHVKEGVGLGLWDTGRGLWTLTGGAATDRRSFTRGWLGLADLMSLDPGRRVPASAAFGRSFTDWDEWSTDPGRATGRVLANVAGVVVGTRVPVGAAADGAEAGVVTGDVAGTLRSAVDGVNPGFPSGAAAARLNCTNCAVAVALRLRGVPARARPLSAADLAARGRSIAVLERSWRTDFYLADRPSIEHFLRAQGSGADGVVYVRWADGRDGVTGHLFNAVNVHGEIHFVDGQSGATDVSHLFERASPGGIAFAHLDGAPVEDLSDYIEIVTGAGP